MKTCRKCGSIKPRRSFSKHSRTSDGLQSYCKQCVNEVVQQWNRDHPNYVRPNETARLTAKDAVDSTYRHCAHIASYAKRAINRIESAGLEAPPQLTAIQQLADGYAAEQRALLEARRRCAWCGATYQRHHGNQKFCSAKCRYSQRDHERVINDPDYNRKHYAKHRDRMLAYSRARAEHLRAVIPTIYSDATVDEGAQANQT